MPSPARSVAVLLVSHDGARWLPAVLDGLRRQTAPVDRVVAVDTGSKDESPSLLADALGEQAVRRVSGATTFPQAVALGLATLAEEGVEPEWVWLLHDDANPDPRCLEALLAAAEADPDVSVLGPKLREWPSLRRLLELGVTISGTGRRETGLERGEYDQGQHDQVREVLAVNTAGMLVRRAVLEDLGGFDEHLPIFGNDVDFGWRAAAAGHRTLVVPQAVVFHAEAAHRGLRRTPLTGRHTHYQERRAALWTLLVNSRPGALPYQLLRLTLGTLVRMVGFLLVRSVGEALDELAALVSVFSSPREILLARRRRADRRTADGEGVRRLLAPWWLPYRHGLDFASDVAAALTHQAADVAERRRAAAAERDPSSFAARHQPRTDDDDLVEDTGLVVRFLTNPVAVLLALVVVLALVGARAGLGAPAGGGLSPAPDSAADWWDLHLRTWHQLGPGTDVPAPAYLMPLAFLATVLLGSAGAAVSAVLVLALPVALWGAWRLLRVVGRLVSPSGAPRWLILWGATTYALVPVLSGAWGDGRLGVVVGAATLPWLAHAALGFADPEADRRWRAAWRTALLLALVTAFLPTAWPVTVAIGLVVVLSAALVVRSAVRDRSVWGPPAAAVGAVPVLLLPWWLPALVTSAGEGLLLDAGRLPGPALDTAGLLIGRFAGIGAPWWLGIVVPVLAVLALLPRATRIPVLVCWVVATVTAAVAAVLATLQLDLAGGSVPPGLGFVLLVVHGALVVAAVLGGQGFVAGRARWRRPARTLGAVLALVAALAPVAGLAWFAAGGHDSLDEAADGSHDRVPAYMLQESETGAQHGILLLRGSMAEGLTYDIRRDDGVTLGEDEILALTPEDHDLTALVRTLVSRPLPGDVAELGERGLQYVLLDAPVDPDVAAALDATAGLVQVSAEDRATRAWQVEHALDPRAASGPTSWLRVALLVVQGVAILVVAVLAAPTTERSRR